jgi:tyrosine-protein kinase Etk/Wzc
MTEPTSAPEQGASDDTTADPGRQARGDELNVLDLMIVVAKRWKLVVFFSLAVAVLAAIYSLLVTPVYTGTARILPPQQAQSAVASVLGQLGALAGAAGGGIGGRQPNEMYVTMLKSRTVADRLIEQFKLEEVFQSQFGQDARLALAGATKIESGARDAIITIDYNDSDPKRAAAVANAYVAELHRLTQTLAVSEASQRRLFFEKQIKQAKEELSTAEVALKKMQEETGLIKLEEQGRVIIESIAQLRAQIVAREVQVSAMRTFATEQNPEYLRLREELNGLRRELAKAERAGGRTEADLFIPTDRVPTIGLEYVRRLRDVKYQETLFELLAKQYELARIDESKDSGVVQVLDSAVVPERRTSPRRRLIVMVSFFAAALGGVLLAFALEVIERDRSDPLQRERWQRLRSFLRLR